MTKRNVDHAALAAKFERQGWESLYDDGEQPAQLPATRETYTPGRTALERVPAMPMLANSDPTEDGAFAVASGQALAAGAGGVFEHTSATDRTKADLLRLAYYAGAMAVFVAGLALVAWTDWTEFGVILSAIGSGAMLVALFVHIASLRHSQAGVARYKISTVRAMHRDRLESRERMAMQLSGAWLQLVGKQLEHERKMEEMRYRSNGRK
jgi:hypothetical protein